MNRTHFATSLLTLTGFVGVAAAQQASDANEWGQEVTPLPSVVAPADLVPTNVAPSGGATTPIYLDQLPLPPEDPGVRVAGLVSRTIPSGEQIAAPVETPAPNGLPPGTRNGIFQKAYFTTGYFPALSNQNDALGFIELDAGIVLGFPFFRRDTPLLVTPDFDVLLLDNNDKTDLPGQLYAASIDFNHLRKFGDGPWAMNAAVTVGYYSDFQQSDSRATRVTGRAFAVYESSPRWKWVAGIVYLNRAGVTVLPAGGAIYTPNENVRYDLILPKPKAARRLAGSTVEDERWIYVGGEFGGGAWSITHPSTGQLDFLSYSDLRALIGYERKKIGGLSHQIDFGYVFARNLKFNDPAPDVALDDTLFIRGTLRY